MADRTPSAARPYPHQVGGHGQLAMTSAGHVLKPSSAKEHAFYSYIYSDRLPPHLLWIRSITPKYYGQADFPDLPDAQPKSATSPPFTVSSHHLHNNAHPPLPDPAPDSDLLRAPATSLTATTTNTSATIANHHNQNQPTQPQHPHRQPNYLHAPPARSASCAPHPNNLHNHAPPPPTPPQFPHEHPFERPPATPEHATLRWRTTDGTKQASISPWAAQMGSRWQNSSNPARRARPSIALEDINRAFRLPCVMDCKIGTRHYDDDASEEKRRRHILKANATTTAKCGVRYTGMQSFKREKCPDSTQGMFEVRDKYHGRTLTEHDLVPEATWFFHDSHRVRTDCVKLILDKIHDLRRLLIAQHHFYFYSSSLLLVYEGALPDAAPTRVDVRMIDFAHTVLSKGNRDDGYVQGIDYLIRILTNILENDRAGVTVLPPTTLSEATSEATTAANAAAIQAELPGDNDDDEDEDEDEAGGGSSAFDPPPMAESMESPLS